jgi:hypothetical protein
MATTLKLKADIKKLKAAIDRKGTPANILPKLKAQLEKVENELASMKKGASSRKVSTTKGTTSTLSKLQKMVQSKKYSAYQGSNVDLKKDADEGALPIGRRISKGLKANGVSGKGNAKANKGRVYYEYRPNRLDVKQPKAKQTYPKLAEGGMMAKGGEFTIGVDKSNALHSQYFVYNTKTGKRKYFASKKEAEDYLKQSKDGGYMAEGGKIPQSEIKEFREYVGEYYGNNGMYEEFFTTKGASKPEMNYAINQYLKYLRSKDAKNEGFSWGGGDTFDREIVRDIMHYHRGRKGLEYKNFLKAMADKGYLENPDYDYKANGGIMADGGETEEKDEEKVIRGFSDDEPYEYKKGGINSKTHRYDK